MKNVFNGFITRLDVAEERIIGLEDMSIGTSKLEYPGTVRPVEKVTYSIMRIPAGENRERRTEEMFETTVADNSPKVMSDAKPEIHKAQRAPNRVMQEQRGKRKTTPLQIIFRWQKSQGKEKILKEAREKNHLPKTGAKLRSTSDSSP